MKYLLKIPGAFLIMFFLVACSPDHAHNAERPSRRQVLKAMHRANNYFMNAFPDPGKDLIQPPDNVVWKSNIWTWGTYASGAMAYYQVSGEKQVLEYLRNWGESHHWKISTKEMFNDHLAGQTYIQLYELDTSRSEIIADVKRSIDIFIESGDVEGRVFGDNWNWVDAAYMAMPLFAQLGTLTGEDKYLIKMHELYLDMKNDVGGGLFNAKDGLWWRDASFKPPYTEPNGEDCYWSRGNGWVLGALVRTLQFMPAGSDYRDEYIGMIRQMCDALLKVRREDGMWNVSLHDPDHYGGRELSGTALFVYGMAWGVNNGILEADKYKPAIYKAWNTMVRECLHPGGFLGYVQGTGEQPSSGQPVSYSSMPDFEDYGLGAFLLAGSELLKTE